jgi:hypothetical protein
MPVCAEQQFLYFSEYQAYDRVWSGLDLHLKPGRLVKKNSVPYHCALQFTPGIAMQSGVWDNSQKSLMIENQISAETD